MTRLDCDVLVSGLGPVGAALTAMLAKQGLSVIALDKELTPHPMPRAVHFDHEVMRIFQGLGVAEAVQAHTRDVPAYEFRSANDELLISINTPAETPSGWKGGYMFHQPGLEEVLRLSLQDLPGAQVKLGWRLNTFAQDKEGVTATIASPEGEQQIRARYLVGCDGAWSPVREAIGGGLFDYQFDEPWLVVDVKLLAESRVPEVNLQICDPARPTTCVISGPGRHRWEFMMLSGETPEAMLKDEVIEGLLATWECGPLEIERKAVYRFHGLVANRWRDQRVFIAGDAAHQTPPFAGQGMCAGIRDAANLAWKLAAVIGGQAQASLLETYQAEREPHVRTVIELAIGMGQVVCTLDREAAAARDAHMLAMRQAGMTPLPPLSPAPLASSCILPGDAAAGLPMPQPTAVDGEGQVLRLDDILGGSAWLIAKAPVDQDVPGLRMVDLSDERLAMFGPALSAWLEQHQAQAVLVRPDRYVFGTGTPSALISAWTASLRGSAPSRLEDVAC